MLLDWAFRRGNISKKKTKLRAHAFRFSCVIFWRFIYVLTMDMISIPRIFSIPYLRNLKNASGGMIEDFSSAWRIWGRYLFLVLSGTWSDDLRPAKFESLLEHKIIWCSVAICKVKVLLQFLKLIKFCKNKTNKLTKYVRSRIFLKIG